MLLSEAEDHADPGAIGEPVIGPCAVGDPVHVEKSFVRNPGDLARVRRRSPDRFLKAQAERGACTRARSRIWP